MKKLSNNYYFIFLILFSYISICFSNEETIVNTEYGSIRGVIKETNKVYFGVPFAIPPIGDLRWSAPLDPFPWYGTIYNATKQKSICPQICSDEGYSLCDEFGISEDCLYLDIFTPLNSNPNSYYPVMINIPGGAFMIGSGNSIVYDGSVFANQSSIIIVNINYRLGALGFLSSNMFTSFSSGNFGFLDQVKALQWVRNNINSFGGDNSRITLFGQSAGGYSVGIHLSSKLSSGLFHRAIIHSSPFTVKLKSKETSLAYSSNLAIELGCNLNNLTCIRSISFEKILENQLSVGLTKLDSLFDNISPWSPVIDGINIVDQPIELFKSGKIMDIPIIFGNVGDESPPFIYGYLTNPLNPIEYKIIVSSLFIKNSFLMESVLKEYPPNYYYYSDAKNNDNRVQFNSLFNDYAFLCTTKQQVMNIKKTEKINSNIYYFLYDHKISIGYQYYEVCKNRNACHSDELMMLFNSNILYGNNITNDEIILSKIMNTYWSNFIKTGNPNNMGPSSNSQPQKQTIPIQWLPYSFNSFNTLLIGDGNSTEFSLINLYDNSYKNNTKWKPLESLPVPVLSAEVRSRGGKIKTNSIKSQIMAQLIEMLEIEKEQQALRENQAKRNTKLIIPLMKNVRTPTKVKTLQHHSTLIKGTKYKSREDFYNRFKNKPDDETFIETPNISSNETPTPLKITTTTTTPTTTSSTSKAIHSISTPTSIITTPSSLSKRKILHSSYQLTSSEDESSYNRDEKRPLKKLNFKSQYKEENENDEDNSNTEIYKAAIELEKKILHQYNLYPILERLPKSNKHIGYVLAKEYVRFIVLKVIEKDSIPCQLEPSPLINELWNAHILSTTKYDELSNLIQYKVHNDPDGFFDPKQKIIKRFEKTISLYKKYFNTSPDPKIWVCPL
ncbi:hypothetical protein RB653_007679 [Dictyostelium firmibasis]|uniref:Carboxylesterase type B domain-containing protein n=1 Tax=Dictyostelium firmibasis TaxID=79012 RepID=A0AAN7TWW9_9MYCE